MASGAQTFVRALEPDGRAPGEEGAGLEPCGAGWDRLTAVVRRLESRAGKLFSVLQGGKGWQYFSIIAPLALQNAVNDFVNVEAAGTVGDEYSPFHAMMLVAV